MDVVDTFNLVRRRKFVVIPVLLLTVLLAVFAIAVLPPGYSAQGSVLVKDAVAERSPVTPALFAESLQDQEARSEIRDKGATGPYVVSASDDLLLVKSTAPTEAEAVATVNAVLESMSGRLETLETEAGVEPALQSQVTVVNAPETAIPTEAGFEASGSATVEGANAGATPVDGETLRDALVQVLSSPDVANEIWEEGGTAEYDFGFQKGSPILGIEATGSDETATVDTVRLLVAEAGAQSTRLADELGGQKSSGTFIEDLVVPNTAVVDRKGPLRSVAAIGIVGVGLALSLAVALEAYAEWRRRNASEDAVADLADEDVDEAQDADHDTREPRSSVGQAVGPQGWRRAPVGPSRTRS